MEYSGRKENQLELGCEGELEVEGMIWGHE